MVVQNCDPGAAHGKWQLGAKKNGHAGHGHFFGVGSFSGWLASSV
jgi:hypothetical protein